MKIGANKPIAFFRGFGLRRDSNAIAFAQSQRRRPARIFDPNESEGDAYEVIIGSNVRLPVRPQFPHRDSKCDAFPFGWEKIDILPDTMADRSDLDESKIDWEGARNGFNIATSF